MIRTSIAAAVATLLVAATAGVALADNAVVTRNAYVYEDNDTDSDVLGVIEEGEYVNVLDCGGNWCLIELRGPNGYVRKNRLAFAIGPADDDDVDVNLGFGINSNGNFSLGFGIGN
jgi:uncharacterized protein YraI